MNDNLHPVGNESLETRITAYVLGEASPFEAAELESLIAASPELQLIHNRTRTLHSLLTEAQTTSNNPSEDWKLPTEKRAKLAPILGTHLTKSQATESRIRRAAFISITAIAACVTITLFTLRLAPWQHEAEAIVEIRPRTAVLAPFGTQFSETRGNQGLTPQFFGTELEPIKSKRFLGEVVENLDLTARWNTDKQTAIKKLERSIKTEPVKGTDLVSIRVRQNNEEDANEITRELALRYQDLLTTREKNLRREATAELAKAVREQEDKVEERRKVLSTISRAKGLVYHGDTGEAITRSIDTNHYIDAKRDFEADQELLTQMKLKLMAEKITENMPEESLIIHDIPPARETKAIVTYSPTPPSSSTAKVIAATTASETAIPVPDLAQKSNLSDSSDLSDLSDPSASFGSPDSFGAGWGDNLRSGDAAITRNSIDAILNNPDRNASPRQDGIAVGGHVKQPSRLDFKDGLTLEEAVVRSGGATEFGSRKRVRVTRDGKVQTYDLDDKDLAQIKLQPGDTIEMPQKNFMGCGSSRSEVVPPPSQEIPETQHPREADTIRRSPQADGELNLGKFDDAKKSYEEALRIDPYNSDRAIYDPTRAEGEGLAPSEIMSLTGTFSKDSTSAWNDRLETFTGYRYSSNIRAGSERNDLSIIRQFENPTEHESPLLPLIGGGLRQDLTDKIPNLETLPLTGRLFQEKQPTLTDLSQEILATQEPFSTFSLNISDASFQLALAAVAKGERPDPAAIKPEQFYNAIEYADPAPSHLEPVAAAIDQTAHPVIPGRNLVRIALRTASAGRSAAQPLRLTLLVDQSGSMARADRRAAMDIAIAQLATLLTDDDQITVIGFARTPRLLADSLPGNQAAKLPDLINQTSSQGGTNLEQALILASELALRHHLPNAQNRIVLFTDGAANLGDANPDGLTKKIETLRQQNISFDIAGIGTTDLNDQLLSELARHGNGRYHLVSENTAATLASQLAGAFRPAAENVKVQVKFNPARVGYYKLHGFEKDRLKTEDFRNDSVDAAELAADEAGIALYQIETLPAGSGEIGEVSVRFRDTATAEMTEHTWTIPYDPATPAFDRADPKTQLATLALLAAQKLQPGPLADAINFADHAQTIANLKRTHPHDQKIQQLLNLINTLK